jgi:hypothetical protein
VLLGTAAGEVVNGKGGYYDQLFGNGGADTINSGSSGDFMSGGDGNDQLFGNGGDDRSAAMPTTTPSMAVTDSISLTIGVPPPAWSSICRSASPRRMAMAGTTR